MGCQAELCFAPRTVLVSLIEDVQMQIMANHREEVVDVFVSIKDDD